MKRERRVVLRFIGGCFMLVHGGSRQERGKMEEKRKRKEKTRNDN